MSTKKHSYLPFDNAKEYAQSLGIKNRAEWKRFVKSGNSPKSIPTRPDLVYCAAWQGWGDFFGNRALTPNPIAKDDSLLANSLLPCPHGCGAEFEGTYPDRCTKCERLIG